MKISIALCTYNGEQYLPEQLQSIVQQTRLPDEIIICDDGSTDTTPLLLNDFKRNNQLDIRIVHNEKNLGSTKNFEQAIRLCTGDIIVLSDQDDVWHIEKLETFEEAFKSSPTVTLVASDMELVGENLETLNKTMWQQLNLTSDIQARLESDTVFVALLKKNYITGAAMAFRSEYRDMVLPISSYWIHDKWIATIIAAFSSFVFIKRPLTKYRQHASNQIGQASFLSRASKSQRTTRQAYENEVAGLKEIKHRLDSLRDTSNYDVARSLFEEKIDHMIVRSQMPEARLKRLPIIIRELIHRRYQQFSVNGIASAIRDFIV